MSPDNGRRYLVITLAATYPEGSVGYVTATASTPDEGSSAFDVPTDAMASEFLIETVEGMEKLYETEIGQAYSKADMTFTVHEVVGQYELYDLMGETVLRRRGTPGTRKPNVGGW